MDFFSLIQTVEEKCVYKPSPENPSVTVCERQAWISSNLFGFSYLIQSFGYERFKGNAHKAVRGFEHVLNRLYMPETIPMEQSFQQHTDKIKNSAKKAKEKAREKAKEKVAVVASYTGGTAAS